MPATRQGSLSASELRRRSSLRRVDVSRAAQNVCALEARVSFRRKSRRNAAERSSRSPAALVQQDKRRKFERPGAHVERVEASARPVLRSEKARDYLSHEITAAPSCPAALRESSSAPVESTRAVSPADATTRGTGETPRRINASPTPIVAMGQTTRLVGANSSRPSKPSQEMIRALGNAERRAWQPRCELELPRQPTRLSLQGAQPC